MDYQIILDIAIGVAMILGGWVFKILFSHMKESRDQLQGLLEKTRNDYRELNDNINALALSIPEKYVSKDNFNSAIQSLNHRFDRLDEKLDAILRNGKK